MASNADQAADLAAHQAPPTETATASATTINEESQLAELIAKGTLQYSVKNYSAAADVFAQASELQAKIHGEDSPKNAELYYFYGRSLYQVGISQSDVLGAKVAGEKEDAGGAASPPGATGKKATEEIVGKAAEKKSVIPSKPKDDVAVPSKPYFQFTGDENFDNDSDEDEDVEEGAGEGGEAAVEDDDDLQLAWDMLDLARVLFTRRLEELQGTGKGKASTESEDIKHVKERLSDVHDLLAEISLESENFPSAVTDFKAALTLKEELYPKDSSVLAEAHYKLSLALEFAATTTAAGENGETKDDEEPKFDEAGREEAAKEMEAAIESCKLRVEREEAELASKGAAAEGETKKAKVTRQSIDEVQEMIAEMEQRLTDLRAPLMPAGAADVLGSIFAPQKNLSPEQQHARHEEAAKNAIDITKLVRRKKDVEGAKKATQTETGVNGNGKRKVDSLEDGNDTPKRARVEDADD